jgi:hypothetical protein
MEEGAPGQDKKHDSMDEVVENGFFPDGSRLVAKEQVLEAMGAEGAQGHGQHSKQGGNPQRH